MSVRWVWDSINAAVEGGAACARHHPSLSRARFDFGLRDLRTDLPAGMAERVEAVLPGPDLAVRSRAAFAWQDEVLRQLTSRSAG